MATLKSSDEPHFTSEPDNPINYKFHVPIVIILVTIQFFIVDIYSHFYLKYNYEKCLSSNVPGSTLFKKGEYRPVDRRVAPTDFQFVVVNKDNSATYETYYTSRGEKEVLEYLNNRFKSSFIEEDGDLYFMFLPFCGFALFILFGLCQGWRTLGSDKYFYWYSRNPLTARFRARPDLNRFETILLIYAVPLCLSPIICHVLGHG